MILGVIEFVNGEHLPTVQSSIGSHPSYVHVFSSDYVKFDSTALEHFFVDDVFHVSSFLDRVLSFTPQSYDDGLTIISGKLRPYHLSQLR